MKLNDNKLFLLSLLGMLTALAPVVNNMFSPCMPVLAQTLNCDTAMVQLCLTASMVGLALGQVLIGPLSDRYGRRAPLLWSMVLYVVASALLLVAGGIELVIGLRLLQGLGAGGGVVISRSIATDMSSGARLMKMLATINVINGIMPIVTPMLGGFLTQHAGYSGPFAGMQVVGVLLTLGCWFLSETLAAESRSSTSLAATLALFGRVTSNREYLYTILHQGGALAVLFGNIAATPFILQNYGYGPESIGMALGINGIFTAVGAGCAPMLGDSLRGIKVTASGLLVLAAAQFVVLWMDMGLWPYEVLVCLMLVFVGVTLTSSSSHAMDCARDQAGTASALLGAVGFVVGAVVAPLMGLGNLLHSAAVCYLCAAVLAAASAVGVMNVHKRTES
ncbi:MAG: Bcr/CflA family efflux MFS transporter [Muribaculaceae bacterium]|nr:Bcr/CflA family efflux MFS transporter [Muribaculaceae bacterium]